MRTETHLPHDLLMRLSNERKDFIVKAARAYPAKLSLFFIFFAVFWLLFTSVFIVAFFLPIFLGNEVNLTVNDVPTVASANNLKPLLIPAIVIGVFVLMGILVLVLGFYFAFKKGGYYIGTPERLIKYEKNTLHSYDWEQFNGNITVSGDNQKGNVALEMRTGRMVSRKTKNREYEEYVPNIINMIGIDNALTAEQLCRKRIKENDPTPVNS